MNRVIKIVLDDGVTEKKANKLVLMIIDLLEKLGLLAGIFVTDESFEED